MLRVFYARDSGYEGVFMVAVRTTGIFCRPSCSARKPKPENVTFFATSREALLAGYRPCLRCCPLQAQGSAPEWLKPLLAHVEKQPTRRWTDADIRALKVAPERVRRWFQKHHDMTFHGYLRARRLGQALGHIKRGAAVLPTALEHGYRSLSGFNDAFQKLLGAPPTRAKHDTRLFAQRITTPLGPMLACVSDSALCLLEFVDRRGLERQLRTLRRRLSCRLVLGRAPLIERLVVELAQYFAGTRRAFTIELELAGTPFQQQVWRQLVTIPCGETRSYGGIARSLGRPTASRAVARANGDNRIALLVPCHRVIGSNGHLTGYAGGLWRKQRLLELEGALTAG
ncbi:MAG TPA: bifunctional transcriptional activator/DNA repair protein Ada [Sorangium sp.]|nr:bifunctional transcriptional activator/DNA repair protein Ada [Sorangium sp.]